MESNPNYMNQYDFGKVLDAIPTLKIRKWKDDDIRFLMKILYHMALRPIEGITLEKKNFDLKNRMCYLGKTKTESHSKVVIPRVFIDELTVWINEKEDGSLFPGLKYRTFWVWLKRLGLMLDIDAWLPDNRIRTGENTVGHIFRKSWGKDALDNDLKIDVISKHLRHSKPSMTMDKYLKADLKKVFDTI